MGDYGKMGGVQTPSPAGLTAESIKSKLAELTPDYMQKHYRREFKYLNHIWGWSFHCPSPLITWSMAKDFSRRFPRHSYEEWAFVLGIPKGNDLIFPGLHPGRVRTRRRTHEAQHRIKWFFILDTALILAVYFVLSR